MALRLKANRRFPSIPVVVDDSANHTQVLMAVKEALDIGQRRTGDLLNSFIRVEDLIDLGLITIEGNTNSIVGADLSEIADIGDLSGAAAGDFLRFDGSEWVNDQLKPTDITQTMVTQHQAALSIAYSQITGAPAIPSDLDDLTDVTITSPNTNDVLTFNGSQWVPAAPTGGGGGASYLDDLLDVDAPYPRPGDVLTWDGYGWVNDFPDAGDASIDAGDPYWDYVVSCLNFEGADGATSVTDGVTRRAWTFVGNAQLDDSVNTPFGVAGTSLLLDGTGDYITTPNSVELQVTSRNHTVEAWVMITATGKTHTISNKRDGSGAEEHSLAVGTTQLVSYSLFNSTAQLTLTSTTALSTNVWYHVAGVVNGTTGYLFINGVLEAVATRSGAAATNTGVLHIGRDGFDTSRDFQGRIGGYRFTMGAPRYLQNFTVPDGPFETRIRGRTLEDEIVFDGPMAWWKCDEASGAVADSSGNGYSLTVTGTMNYLRAPIIPNRSQKFLRVPASSGTIYARRAGTLGFSTPVTSSHTIVCVARVEELQASDSHRFFVMGASGETEATNYQIYVGVDSSGFGFFFWEYGAGTNFTFTGNKRYVPRGNTAHFAFVKDVSTRTLSIYINGELAEQGTWTSGQDVIGGGSCSSAIGDEFGSANSGFTIAHLAVYNTVLSDERIRRHAIAAGFRET